MELLELLDSLCHKPSFPPQMVPVTRITSCQPGVEGLDRKGNFPQDTRVEKRTVILLYIYICEMQREVNGEFSQES